MNTSSIQLTAAVSADTVELPAELIAKMRERAVAYRRDHELPPTDGFVEFYRDQPKGWMWSLLEPKRYCPGLIAVSGDESVPCFRAAGGNDMAGAERWDQVTQA
jgi:hypothetical protein